MVKKLTMIVNDSSLATAEVVCQLWPETLHLSYAAIDRVLELSDDELATARSILRATGVWPGDEAAARDGAGRFLAAAARARDLAPEGTPIFVSKPEDYVLSSDEKGSGRRFASWLAASGPWVFDSTSSQMIRCCQDLVADGSISSRDLGVVVAPRRSVLELMAASCDLELAAAPFAYRQPLVADDGEFVHERAHVHFWGRVRRREYL